MEKQEFKKAIHQSLVLHGFQKRKDNWYVESDDTIALVNLQSSNYTSRYYVNLAAWIKVLGTERNPKEWKCPIRIRLDAAYPNERDRIERVFDLEDDRLTDDDRKNEITSILECLVVPFISKFHSIESLQRAYSAGELSGGGVNVKAKKIILDWKNQVNKT